MNVGALMSSPSARRLAPIVRWNWTRVPPVMERSLRDDVKVAFFVLLGVTVGYLVFGADDSDVLLGALVGLVAVTVVLNVLRRVRLRRKT